MTGRNRDALAETLAVFETTATPRTPLTASEVAASLGVSSPTFHQHLRKAERKVFDSLLGGSAVEEQ